MLLVVLDSMTSSKQHIYKMKIHCIKDDGPLLFESGLDWSKGSSYKLIQPSSLDFHSVELSGSCLKNSPVCTSKSAFKKHLVDKSFYTEYINPVTLYIY